MKKAIALKRTDAELEKIFEEMIESKDRFTQKLTFLRKQIDQASKEYTSETQPLFKAMRERLTTLNLLPKDFQENDILSYEREAEVLYWIREEPGGEVASFIKSFFGVDDTR